MKKDKYFKRIKKAEKYIRKRIGESVEIGMIVGTGLGSFAEGMEVIKKIPFKKIPNFPTTTVKGHKSNLIYGKVGNKKIIALQGRLHYYEGYNMKEVTFPVRVLRELGVKTIIMSNATGGLGDAYNAGDIALVTDHISFHNENPLRGENNSRLGPRFPDMFHAYSKRLIELCEIAGRELNIKLHRGVYFGLPGPNLETPAEYNMIKTLGGDLVGMSTVPEVIVAVHAGMEVLVCSVVTNICYPLDKLNPTTHSEVIDVAEKAEQKLRLVISKLITKI